MNINKELNKKQSSFDFLSIVLGRLQNNFHQEFLLGRTIPRKSLYKSFAVWFSFKIPDTRKCLRLMASRYDFLEFTCLGLKVLKKNRQSSKNHIQPQDTKGNTNPTEQIGGGKDG